MRKNEKFQDRRKTYKMKNTKLGDLQTGDFFKFADEIDYLPEVVHTFKSIERKHCFYFSEVGGYVLTNKEKRGRLVVKVKS
jgi:hypothetical protein